MSSKAQRGKHINALEQKLHTLEKRANKMSRPSVLRSNDQTEATFLRNSKSWVAGVFHPFDRSGERYPETCTSGSEIAVLRDEIVLEMKRFGTDNNWTAGCIVSPNLTKSLKMPTAASDPTGVGYTPGQVTGWTYHDHPNLASMAANSECYRVTSLGIKVHNVGVHLNRGGRVQTGTFPAQYTNHSPGADAFQLMTTMDTCHAVDGADLEDLESFWIPLTHPTYVYTETQTNGAPVGLSYRRTASEIVDNAIAFMLYAPYAEGGSNSITVERIMTVEFIPKWSKQFLFDPQTSAGSPDSNSRSWYQTVTHLARLGVNSVLETGSKYVRDPIAREKMLNTMRALSVGTPAAATVAAVSRLSSLHTAPMHYELLKVVRGGLASDTPEEKVGDISPPPSPVPSYRSARRR